MRLMVYVKTLVVIVLLGVVILGGYLYSGLYPIGADTPHNKLTYWALETLRENSVARAAKAIPVPVDLATPSRLLAGGPDYNEMCSGCHLRPGRAQSDFTQGLYPAPPNLTRSASEREADIAQRRREHFWIIKHGIKASGMPAWGPTHDDERIWNMVAFLERLPELTPEQYQILTARDEEDGGGHH